jgi:phosphohistidine phosphatase
VKTITLMRHGHANNKQLGSTDFERTLSHRGIEEATNIADKIFGLQISVDIFICSAAERTQQTCKILAERYQYPAENILSFKELYSAGYEEVLLLLQGLPNEINNIALIGHNPTMSECATLLNAEHKLIDMPTAGCISIEYETENWENFMAAKNKILHFSAPKF